jgi:hypothetical protein
MAPTSTFLPAFAPTHFSISYSFGQSNGNYTSLGPKRHAPNKPRYSKNSSVKPPPAVFVEDDHFTKALSTVVVGEAVASCIAIGVDNLLFGEQGYNEKFYLPYVGVALAAYKVLRMASRYNNRGTWTLYEELWACNMALTQVVVATLLARPFIAGMAMAAVSGVQLAWYIDALSYMYTGEAKIGIMGNIHKSKNLIAKFFASHHFWFLPLCLYLTQGLNAMPLSLTFPAMMIHGAFLIPYCRYFTPFEVRIPGKEEPVLMNVNNSYAFWQVDNLSVLNKFDYHSLLYVPAVVTVGNIITNGLPHLLLVGLSQMEQTA